MGRFRGTHIVVVSAWALLVGAGMWWQFRSDSTPGARGNAPAIIPVIAGVPDSNSGPTVIMAIHPRCPCSVSSLHELERVHNANGELPLRIILLVGTPQPVDDEWHEAVDRVRASAPFAHVVLDPGGRQAAMLGMKTSGSTCLYDGTGRLMFSGGLTVARGVEGASSASDRLIELLHTTAGNAAQGPVREGVKTPVFGCELISPNCNNPQVRSGV